MYEDYIPKTKQKNKNTVRKAGSDRTNRRESSQSRKTMSPISLAFSGSTPLHMVRFADHEYGKEPGTYTWTRENQNRINTAITDALTHLSNAHNYVKDNRSNLAIIDKAIMAVCNVLRNDTLSIFPLPDSEKSFGMASKGHYEISISLKHNRTPFDYSKTLIHEAFHIIGGCWDITDAQENVLMAIPDEKCNNKTGRDSALRTLLQKNDIRCMSADHFAQFVMKC